MLKQISKLELKIGEKIYQFLLDSDSPLEHVKESLFQFQKVVGQIEDQVRASQAQNEQSKKEESKVEPIQEEKNVESGA